MTIKQAIKKALDENKAITYKNIRNLITPYVDIKPSQRTLERELRYLKKKIKVWAFYAVETQKNKRNLEFKVWVSDKKKINIKKVESGWVLSCGGYESYPLETRKEAASFIGLDGGEGTELVDWQ